MELLDDDPGISAQLIKKGIREESATKIVQEEIKPGMVVIDIGSNLGYYALLESRLVGNTGKVYAIEPVEENYEVLCRNIELNNYKNIETFKCAIGNKNEEMEFTLTNGSNWGTMMSMKNASDFYGRRMKKISKDKINVNTITLDKFIEDNNIKKVDFIRMDVEGYETEIIKGMQKTLKNMPNLKLFIEFHYSHFKNADKIMGKAIQNILDKGFEPKHLIVRKSNEEVKDFNRHNFVEIVNKHASKFKDECPHIFFEKKSDSEVSIIIPFQSDNSIRQKNLDWIVNRYKYLFPDFEIVIGEDNTNDYRFCKSRAINNAVRSATGKILIIADADMIVSKNSVEKGIRLLEKYPLVLPYNPYFRLNRIITEQILESDYEVDMPVLQKMNSEAVYSRESARAGGMQILFRSTFESVGGYDERFIGWGGEDTCFVRAVETLFGKGKVIDGSAYHLWHPRQSSVSSYKRSKNTNKLLAEKYIEAYDNKTKMLDLININISKFKKGEKKYEKVDFFATSTHYFDHLVYIYDKLDEKFRGNFYYDKIEVKKHAEKRGYKIEPYKRSDRLLVVAGPLPKLADRKLILINHGAGQTYAAEGVRNRSYSGGEGRNNIVLFINPNDHANEMDKKYYPNAEHAVVGCPKMDEWHKRYLEGNIKKRGENPVVAISFHFDCKIVPETRTAYPHYKKVLKTLAKEAKERNWHIIGHGHPRMIGTLEPYYKELGFEIVKDFEEVMERADLYLNDHMSTLFEFASTGRPVVVLNAPWYRRNVEHGLRYWEHADVGINCNEPDELIDCIVKALEDPPEQQKLRKKAVNAVYKYRDSNAAQRAAEAIQNILEQKSMAIEDESVLLKRKPDHRSEIWRRHFDMCYPKTR